LGTGNRLNASSFVLVPMPGKVVRVAAGQQHSLALVERPEEHSPEEHSPEEHRRIDVFSWGNGTLGQVLHNFNDQNSTIKPSYNRFSFTTIIILEEWMFVLLAFNTLLYSR